MLALIEAVIDKLFMSHCAHNFSRAFHDRQTGEDYQICLTCGKRKRSKIQFGVRKPR